MEGNDNQVRSLFEQSSNSVTVNGLLGTTSDDGSHHHTTDPHSVAVAPKKKRGRPRKYESPEQALAARKKAASTTSFPSPSNHNNNNNNPNHKSHSFLLGNVGQGFTPHIIAVATSEDVGQKIMEFIQQSRREMCILSASGSISIATLRQPATSGGSITYEGRFDIISLTGSYVCNELGGRSGGLSVCLSDSNGQLVGGSIAGPLKAAGPVQVIVGTFSIDPKDTSTGMKGDVSTSKLPPPVGDPASSLGFRPAVESSNGNTIPGNEGHQAIGGNHFMLQQYGVHLTPSHPSEWGNYPDSRNATFELTGRTGHGAHQSPENGDYDQIPD